MGAACGDHVEEEEGEGQCGEAKGFLGKNRCVFFVGQVFFSLDVRTSKGFRARFRLITSNHDLLANGHNQFNLFTQQQWSRTPISTTNSALVPCNGSMRLANRCAKHLNIFHHLHLRKSFARRWCD